MGKWKKRAKKLEERLGSTTYATGRLVVEIIADDGSVAGESFTMVVGCLTETIVPVSLYMPTRGSDVVLHRARARFVQMGAYRG